jgi:hypothetical protein
MIYRGRHKQGPETEPADKRRTSLFFGQGKTNSGFLGARVNRTAQVKRRSLESLASPNGLQDVSKVRGGL